ncbi:MAG TPA: homoserine O-acetyltransferase, partial [Flavisolibacter sp.]|nr:homoserine O-acetyltransferase [Flavisolibacter sp.]
KAFAIKTVARQPLNPNKFAAKKPDMQRYHFKNDFVLENGDVLKELVIAYHTYGHLNEAKDNVIWICHALTANSDAKAWWPGLVGEGLVFDTRRYFIVCANILGSCYGTTGPSERNPETGKPYYHDFPFVTIRDMVKAHQLLRSHLHINKIELLAGGSMGGYQALEWCRMEKEAISNLFLIATSARETAWGIGIHTAQRMAIETDPTWKQPDAAAGRQGLKAARAIGMITYRSYDSFVQKQADSDNNKTDDFKASSYILYQGEKLASRFTAYSYWYLTKALDSHNLARGCGSLEKALGSIAAETLVMGISSDLLCPLQEQKFLAEHIPHATFVSIDSLFGHDGFLVETKAITEAIFAWWKD